MFWKLLVFAVLLACFVSSAVAQQYHAVLIDGAHGGDGDLEDTWNDLFLMRRALIASGYDSTKISVLYYDGTDPDVSNPRYHQSSTITTGSAHPSVIQAKFAELATTMTSNDVLFIWTHGHGQYTLDGHSYFDAYDGGGSIRDDTFASWVNPIPCRKKIIFMAQCHSGGFIDDLHDANPNHPAFILTACHKEELSQPADDINTDNESEPLENEVDSYGGPWYHSEFNYHVLNAINRRTILGGQLTPGYPVPPAPLSLLAIKDFEFNQDSYIGKPPEEYGYSPQYDDPCGIGGTTYLDVKMDLATLGKSVSSQATGQNNQRKLYRETSGKLHEVFASGALAGGEIFYRNSTDSGATWAYTARLSDGTMTSLAPCITMGSTSNVFIVVWQQANGSNYNVAYRRSTNGGNSWGPITALQSNFSCASPGPLPSVSSNPQFGYIIVTYGSSLGLRYAKSTNSGTSWTGPSTTPYTDANYNRPASGFYPVPYPPANVCNLAFATTVGYSSQLYYGSYAFSSGTWSAATNLSSVLPGNYSQHVNPTLAVSTTSGTTAHVAWEALVMSPPSPVLVYRKGSLGNFGSQYTVFVLSAYKPSLSGLTDDNAYMLFQNSYGGGGISKMQYHYSGGTWQWTSPIVVSATGSSPQLSVGSSNANYIWTDGTSSPYPIAMGTETLSKTDVLAWDYTRELNMIDAKTGSSISLEIRQPELVHKDGTTSQISFVQAPPDSVLIAANDIFTYGKTNSFAPSAATDTLKFQYVLRTLNSAATLGDAGGILSFNLTNPKAGTVLSTIRTHAIAKSADTTSAAYEVDIPAASIPNRTSEGGLAIEPLLIGVKKDASDLNASLGHIYRLESEGAPQLAKNVVAENRVPPSYLLEQNYPNPFNPSTTLRFGLPEASHVALIVYNTLGQRVAELVRGEMAPGFHEVRWNASGVASGVYVARLTVTDGSGQMLASQAAKLVLMK